MGLEPVNVRTTGKALAAARPRRLPINKPAPAIPVVCIKVDLGLFWCRIRFNYASS